LSPVLSPFDSAQLFKRPTQQTLKTLSFGLTVKFAFAGSTLPQSHSKLTSHIGWEKFKLSPSLVSGFISRELSIRPISELVRFQSPNFKIVSSGGKDRPLFDLKSLTGQKQKLSKNFPSHMQKNDYKFSLMDMGQLKNVCQSVCLSSVCLSVCDEFVPNYLLNRWSDWREIFFIKLKKICFCIFTVYKN
jgi:hypothetical protein